jgi:hypothetical protein
VPWWHASVCLRCEAAAVDAPINEPAARACVRACACLCVPGCACVSACACQRSFVGARVLMCSCECVRLCLHMCMRACLYA